MRTGLARVLASALLVGCATPPIECPPQLPDTHASQLSNYTFLLGAAPLPLATELRESLRGSARFSPSDEIRSSTCTDQSETLVIPSFTRQLFISNLRDRNLFLTYEAAIIVGIPIALVSAAVWPYWGETTLETSFQVYDCATNQEGQISERYNLRTEGRWFIEYETLREAQLKASIKATTRALLTRLATDKDNAR